MIFKFKKENKIKKKMDNYDPPINYGNNIIGNDPIVQLDMPILVSTNSSFPYYYEKYAKRCYRALGSLDYVLRTSTYMSFESSGIQYDKYLIYLMQFTKIAQYESYVTQFTKVKNELRHKLISLEKIPQNIDTLLDICYDCVYILKKVCAAIRYESICFDEGIPALFPLYFEI